MGMQCNFSAEDLPKGTTVFRRYDRESDTWTAEITIQGFVRFEVSAVDFINPSFWFDIGYMSPYAVTILKLLIQNRVPFTCA